MKKILIIIFFSSTFFNLYADRAVTNILSNFNINTTTLKFTFDIYAQSTGSQNIFVGISSFYINYNSNGLSNPIFIYTNSKYTSSSSTGDYDNMSIQSDGTNIQVSIHYTGNGDGIGEILSNASGGEKICTIQMDIINTNETAGIYWNTTDSHISQGTSTISNSFEPEPPGGFNDLLPVELTYFLASANTNNVQLKLEDSNGSK